METLSQKITSPVKSEQEAQFERDGYLVFQPEFKDFETAVQNIMENTGKLAGDLGRIQDAWRYNDAVRNLALTEDIIRTLRGLYQREPIPFQTLNFKFGTQQKTHSDTIHFQSNPPGLMCGVWIALENADAGNGPLCVYPGSHQLPALTMQDFDLTKGKRDYPKYEEALNVFIQEHHLEKKELYLQAGEAVIWQANLLHGGAPIKDSSRTRYSQVTHYFFEGACYYTPKGSDAGRDRIERRQVINIRTGKPVKQYYQGKEIKLKWHELIATAFRHYILKHPRLQIVLRKIRCYVIDRFNKFKKSLPQKSAK